MNSNRIANRIRESRQSYTEVDTALSVRTLVEVATHLGVGTLEIWVAPGNGEMLRIGTEVTKPIRSVPMGEQP